MILRTERSHLTGSVFFCYIRKEILYILHEFDII